MTYGILLRQDANGTIATVNNGDALAVAALPAPLMASTSPIATALGALFASLGTLGEQSAPLVMRLMPQALMDEVRALASRIVGPVYRPARDAVQAARRNDATRMATINETPASLPFLQLDVASVHALDLGGQAAWIAVADRSQLAALLVAGRNRLPTMPDQLWEQVIERHAVLAHIERTGLQANFQLKPSPDAPAAAGPDTDAAENAAREAFKQLRDDRRMIDDAENVLRSVIAAIAVAIELPVDGAFALLNGEAA